MEFITLHSVIFIFSVIFALIVLWQIIPPRGVEQITVDKLLELLAEKNDTYQFIDIRSPEKFERLHVYGFRNIPLNDLKKEIGTLSKDKKVVVICQRGIYGNEACRILKRRGFSDLANVRGGVVSWEPHD
ncbi:MAG TPA: rhodanese-like domain-containing protein [Bacillota bacterium]|nr:rhodanese-like domain-containing protein [Bacillota bacterium]